MEADPQMAAGAKVNVAICFVELTNYILGNVVTFVIWNLVELEGVSDFLEEKYECVYY